MRTQPPQILSGTRPDRAMGQPEMMPHTGTVGNA